jgi:beta-galactosidase/beta-glucuronidase
MRQIWLYVIDEANIETHGGATNQGLEGNKENIESSPYFMKWKNVHLDRTIRMFERDKNYPSIVTWSLGRRLVMAKILCHLSMVKKEMITQDQPI